MHNPSPLTWVLFETAPREHHLRLPGHHLARWLVARGHTVAYVSAPVSPWHFLSRGSRPLARRRWAMEGALGRWRHERLFTFIPRTWMPVHRQWPFDGNASWNGSEYLSRPRAGEVLREAGFDRADVLLVQNFQMPHIVRQVNPRLFGVRLEDDPGGFARMPRTIARRYGELIADADFTTVTARALEPLARSHGAREVLYLPNGVNRGRFRRPESLPPRPQDLPPSPVAVYAGTHDAWFDEELLAGVAQALPAWNFALIGPVSVPMPRLRALRNVHFLGAQQQEQLPPYLWHAQAGIIPFRRNRLVECVAPLKLFEYLAAGLPVVSTRWREMENLASPARLADSVPDFAAALEEAPSIAPRERERLADWAREYDWPRLFARFEAQVRERLARVEQEDKRVRARP